MKFSITILSVLIMLVLASACKKSAGTDNPQPTSKLAGTWHVDYYVAANIATGQPDDTVLATHNDSWKFTEDSLYSDVWFVAIYDQSKNPPVFTAADSLESKHTSAYTQSGNQLTITGSYPTEKLDIVTLTNSKLLVHEKFSDAFTDFYIAFSK